MIIIREKRVCVRFSMNQEAFEGMRCLENSMAVASGVPEVNMTELEIHAATGATNTSSSGVAG